MKSTKTIQKALKQLLKQLEKKKRKSGTLTESLKYGQLIIDAQRLLNHIQEDEEADSPQP